MLPPLQLNPRRLALEALLRVETDAAYANISLGNILLHDNSLSGVDKALLVKLVYGTLTMRIAIDYVLGLYLSRPLGSLTPAIRNILRLGTYQILYLDRVPARAAVDESVKLAHKYGHQGTAGLVNAVLRKISVNKEVPWPNPEHNMITHLAVRYSHPEFLVRRYLDRLGQAETEALLIANNSEGDFCIRANSLHTTPQLLQAALRALGISSRPGNFVSESLYLDSVPSFNGELFLTGQYTVQGEASAFVARLVDPQPGETVLDLCAAPGGKTTHLAELMHDTGVVAAFDINSARLKLVKENALRLGIHIVKTYDIELAAANQVMPPADRVLLDAPCSGFGVLRHKPDIRYNRQEEDIYALAQLQKRLIGQASALVCPGGRLVYSVCTTEPEETVEVVRCLLRIAPEFVLEREMQLLPHSHGVDGFYIAVLTRKGG